MMVIIKVIMREEKEKEVRAGNKSVTCYKGGSNSRRVNAWTWVFMKTGLIASRYYTILGMMSSKYHGLPDIVSCLDLCQELENADE